MMKNMNRARLTIAGVRRGRSGRGRMRPREDRAARAAEPGTRRSVGRWRRRPPRSRCASARSDATSRSRPANRSGSTAARSPTNSRTLISRRVASTPTSGSPTPRYRGTTTASRSRAASFATRSRAMKEFNPDSTALIGELYMELAFFEMTMADNYCNGIPLGHTDAGVQRERRAAARSHQVYDSASNHLDTAIDVQREGDGCRKRLHQSRGSRLEGARAHREGQGERGRGGGAGGCGADDVRLRHDVLVGQRLERHVDAEQLDGAHQRRRQLRHHRRQSSTSIKNALPFASANDPRVPVANGDLLTPKVPPEDGVTRPFYLAQLYKGQFDPLVLASGVDARLVRGRGEASGE